MRQIGFDLQLPQKLLPTVMDLLNDEARLAAMGRAATTLDMPDATHRIAQTVMEMGA